MNSKISTTRGIAYAAVIAAMYTALSLLFQAISFGPLQFRISEALTLLPMLTPYSIPGLIVGCFLSNLLGGYGIYDVIFGTLATAIAALLTYYFRKNKWIAVLPPIVVNAVIVGLVLTYFYNIPLLHMNILTVGVGQAGVCYAIGLPLISLLKKVYSKKVS